MYEHLESHIVSITGPHLGGVKITFKNGYTASIIRDYGYDSFPHPDTDRENRDVWSHWEVAVMRSGEIDYTTPITEDVERHLTDDEMVQVVTDIANLPGYRNTLLRKASYEVTLSFEQLSEQFEELTKKIDDYTKATQPKHKGEFAKFTDNKFKIRKGK